MATVAGSAAESRRTAKSQNPPFRPVSEHELTTAPKIRALVVQKARKGTKPSLFLRRQRPFTRHDSVPPIGICPTHHVLAGMPHVGPKPARGDPGPADRKRSATRGHFPPNHFNWQSHETANLPPGLLNQPSPPERVEWMRRHARYPEGQTTIAPWPRAPSSVCHDGRLRAPYRCRHVQARAR